MAEESKASTIVLGIRDRFMLKELFPQRANLTDQILAVDIEGKLAISQEEAQAIGLVSNEETGIVRWKDGATLDKEIEISKAELEFLDRQIKRLSGEQGLTRDMVGTVLKIQSLIKA